jgi:hypothetical protein
VITVTYVLLLAIITKDADIEWLTVPVAMVSVLFVLGISTRLLFEILLRMPNSEGR